MWLMSSCLGIFPARITTGEMSRQRVGTPALTNKEYVERLTLDGWPAEILNTAAHAHYLNDDEKNLILAHNLVRHNPQQFARQYVAEYISYFRGNEFHYPGLNTILITHEGVTPAIELYRELMNTPPMGLLIPSEGLSQAADLHLQYLVRNVTRGHDGQGGMQARIERFGNWQNKIGENITYGNFSAHDALLFMLIDDQVPDRSHRQIILTPEFRLLGVAKAMHPAFPTGYSYVMNYAFHFEELP